MSDELTAEQAIEILNRNRHRDGGWRLQVVSPLWSLSLFEAKAMAAAYLEQERDEAAKAEGGAA